MDVIPLPYIDIQHDALTVFEDVEQGLVGAEDIWISGYKAGSSSVHGRVRISPREGGGSELKARDGVEVTRLSKTHFEVTVPALGLSNVPVKFPRAVIHPPYTKATKLSPPLQINSIALSPTSAHLLVGGPDGYCGIIPVGPGLKAEDMVRLQGHVGDVLDVKWFPSGEVCLTASSDLSIRLWGKDGINPRILVGHSRAVTSLYIVGVGKQVLSGSKDGTVRLWEVGPAKQLKRWNMDRIRPVEALIAIDDEEGKKDLGGENEERVVLVLTQVGMEIWFWSTPSSGSPNRTLDWGLGSNLVCGAYCPELGVVVTGHTNGVIAFRNLRELETVRCFRRNESPIYSLAFRDTDLYVGTAAGLPCRLRVSRDEKAVKVEVLEEYAGWEAVGVETLAVGLDSVWCAGGEGGVRRY